MQFDRSAMDLNGLLCFMTQLSAYNRAGLLRSPTLEPASSSQCWPASKTVGDAGYDSLASGNRASRSHAAMRKPKAERFVTASGRTEEHAHSRTWHDQSCERVPETWTPTRRLGPSAIHSTPVSSKKMKPTMFQTHRRWHFNAKLPHNCSTNPVLVATIRLRKHQQYIYYITIDRFATPKRSGCVGPWSPVLVQVCHGRVWRGESRVARDERLQTPCQQAITGHPLATC